MMKNLLSKYGKHFWYLPLVVSLWSWWAFFSLPMKLGDIAKFEKMNNLTVNVFGMESYSKPYPMYISKNFKEQSKKHVNLLLYKNHYILIRNLSTFIRPYFWKRCRYFCHKCLNSFTNPLKYKDHYEQECLNISYTG